MNTDLGPISVQDLYTLEGWRYNLYNRGYPGNEIPLTTGGPIVNLANFVDEKGWLVFLGAVFRSPFGTLSFNLDDWNFAINPWYLNLTGENTRSPITVYCNLYNPFTPLGPMYGIAFTPTMSIPYNTRLQVNLLLPAGSPVAATTVHRAAVGKIWIQDEKLFLRSVKRHILEQMTGQKIERYP